MIDCVLLAEQSSKVTAASLLVLLFWQQPKISCVCLCMCVCALAICSVEMVDGERRTNFHHSCSPAASASASTLQGNNTHTHTHTHTQYSAYVVINQGREDGGAKQIREKNPGQYTSSLPLSHTHTFTHIATHFLRPG